MGFTDFKKEAELSNLNSYLLDKSYVEGCLPSQSDAVVFNALKDINHAKFENVVRWYKHISSWSDAERQRFTGAKKPLSEIGGGATAKPASGSVACAAPAAGDDDDFELFGSDEEEDAAAEKLKAERVAAYSAKKSTKPAVIAKSNIILDVKVWDDEADMKKLEECVRSVQCDGLLWGSSKLVPVGYGIKKLQITCVVEDDKVGTDFLEEEICKFEDLVQSVDVAAFNKI